MTMQSRPLPDCGDSEVSEMGRPLVVSVYLWCQVWQSAVFLHPTFPACDKTQTVEQTLRLELWRDFLKP